MDKVTCPLCQRELTKQGFGGHMWGTHGVKIGEHAKLADVGTRVVKLEDAIARVAKLEDALPKLTRLEHDVSLLLGMHKMDGLDDGKHKTRILD